jgi:hypothetical protein
MASLEQIVAAIRDIANRPKNVTFEEIEWVVNQLRQFYDVGARTAKHGTLFRVENHRFMVSGHNPGNKQVKKYCVEGFIAAMIELGIYEDES